MPYPQALLIQIGLIVAAARLLGVLLRRIHQPHVVGEMMVGILLGPSVLGVVSPGLMHALFPEEGFGFLNAVGQVGLIVFMFLVGLEVSIKGLKEQGRVAAIIGNTSIAAPFILGASLAPLLYGKLAGAGVPFIVFALFMGASTSVTAFPVLARILRDKGLLRSRVGMVAIAGAAAGDVTAWCVMALIIPLAHGGGGGASPLTTSLLLLAYICLMWFAVKPLYGRLCAAFETQGRLSQDLLAKVLLILLASAVATELLGVHVLFGAFMAGVIMPKEGGLAHELTRKLESMTIVLLLPIFFALAGLKANVGLISGGDMWFYCLLIFAVAVAGKLGGAALSGRAVGLSWREAGAVGALMNTRGLMELVILNIGLDVGIISPALYSMMVLMALATTFMASPLLDWIYSSPLADERAVLREAEAATLPPQLGG